MWVLSLPYISPRAGLAPSGQCAKAVDANGQPYPHLTALPFLMTSHDGAIFALTALARCLRFNPGSGSPASEPLQWTLSRSILMTSSISMLLLEPNDDGIVAELSKKVIRDGEQRLMLAMLESATEDFQKYVLATDKRGKQLFLAAEEWILATDDPSFFL
mgnify:CR=1 FL=1